MLEPKNPMMSALMTVLIFEMIVVWLSFPGMLQVEGVALTPAIVAVAVVTLLCIAAIAGLRRGWGLVVGWVAQVGMLLLGFLTPWMFAVGIIFGVIWVTAVVLGKRIEARKKEA